MSHRHCKSASAFSHPCLRARVPAVSRKLIVLSPSLVPLCHRNTLDVTLNSPFVSHSQIRFCLHRTEGTEDVARIRPQILHNQSANGRVTIVRPELQTVPRESQSFPVVPRYTLHEELLLGNLTQCTDGSSHHSLLDSDSASQHGQKAHSLGGEEGALLKSMLQRNGYRCVPLAVRDRRLEDSLEPTPQEIILSSQLPDGCRECGGDDDSEEADPAEAAEDGESKSTHCEACQKQIRRTPHDLKALDSIHDEEDPAAFIGEFDVLVAGAKLRSVSSKGRLLGVVPGRFVGDPMPAKGDQPTPEGSLADYWESRGHPVYSQTSRRTIPQVWVQLTEFGSRPILSYPADKVWRIKAFLPVIIPDTGPGQDPETSSTGRQSSRTPSSGVFIAETQSTDLLSLSGRQMPSSSVHSGRSQSSQHSIQQQSPGKRIFVPPSIAGTMAPLDKILHRLNLTSPSPPSLHSSTASSQRELVPLTPISSHPSTPLSSSSTPGSGSGGIWISPPVVNPQRVYTNTTRHIFQHSSVAAKKSLETSAFPWLSLPGSRQQQQQQQRHHHHHRRQAMKRRSENEQGKTNCRVSLRDCFQSRPGYLLMSFDYSQIELRLVTHFSHDRRLLHQLRQGGQSPVP